MNEIEINPYLVMIRKENSEHMDIQGVAAISGEQAVLTVSHDLVNNGCDNALILGALNKNDLNRMNDLMGTIEQEIKKLSD